MNVHKNARTTPYSRAEIARRVLINGDAPSAVATALGVSLRTVAKWLARYHCEGEAGLADRSSRPRRMPRATASGIVEQVIALRRQPLVGKQIARMLGLSPATVSRILRKVRLSRARDLDPPEPVRRYERQHPGELIHIDIKKLGRFERVGHRITGDRTRQSNTRGYRAVNAMAQAGSMYTSASTTPRASPSARCSPTKSRKAPSPSFTRRSPATKASASP